jgi:hypothetical protein
MLTGGWLRSVGKIGAQRAVDQVREPSLQAADASLALVVGAAFGVSADLGDRYCVERPAELTRRAWRIYGDAPEGEIRKS